MHPLQQQQHHYQGGGGTSGCGGPLSSPTAANGRSDMGASVGRRVLNGRGGASQSLLGAATLPHGGGAGSAGGGANLWSSPTSSPFPISLDAVRNLLHSTGYTEEAVEEIIHAVRVLNGYGLLSLTSLASWVGFSGSGGCGGNGPRTSVSPQVTTVPPLTEPSQDAIVSVPSPFGSTAFPSAPTGTLQQQSQQQQSSPPVDTFYRPQNNGSGPTAANNTDSSSR